MESLTSLDGDTIVAIATPPGRGGVGIIRISGSKALEIAQAITNRSLEPRHAHFSHFKSAENVLLDTGITLFFPTPHSFTGEDVVELQAHGGPIVLDLLVAQCCQRGARMARPGEFSERAYLNNKIDLAQAEAIADLINSTTAAAALGATRSLEGEFSAQVHKLVESLTQLRIYVEAAIDFPEEEIDFISDGVVAGKLQTLVDQLHELQQQAQQGKLIREGMKVVIAGKPNAGKSSLLNALAGQDTAIVTAIEGTTRDVLSEHIQIDGMPLHIVDTAGLRDSEDAIEQEGIRRAWKEIKTADRILYVVDASLGDVVLPETLKTTEAEDLPKSIPVTLIYNKSDLGTVSLEQQNAGDHSVIALSAKTGEGLQELKDHLKSVMGYKNEEQGRFSARQRHLQSLNQAASYLQAGQQQLLTASAGELLAEDLKHCQNALGEITGAVSSDELLGKIFSDFCIGK